MDIKDVSDVDNYREFFDRVTRLAERASRRKGENPQDHPPPYLVVSQFMMSLSQATSMGTKGNHTISTSQVPPYYYPCVLPTHRLTPLTISSMTLEHHHRGNLALIHVLTPPDRMTAVMAVVEDEEGTAVLLQLYNQPEEPRVSKEWILRVGDVCIIKEPFFKATTSGSYSLRVDHVSDIVWLKDTDDRIPLKWRKRVLCLDETSKDIRRQGNTAVHNQNWTEAEYLYTRAICIATTPEEQQLAHLNRSLTNLHLNRPKKALYDASKSCESDIEPNEKALFRQAKAFYSLAKFKLCMEKLIVLVRCNPRNTDTWAEIRRVKQRLLEEETGSYDFASMYKQAEATPPLIDCATYVGPVAVRNSVGRGRGLFTTRAVKSGELLFCEKAFAYSYAGDDSSIGRSNTTILMNLSTGTICVGGQAHLITQVVQKLYHDPSEAKVFIDLYHGDYTPVKTFEADGSPVVDTFFVAKIIQLNCFGAPRSSYNSIVTDQNYTDTKESEKPTSHTTCGIWSLASRINHSCISNCRRSFIGDMQIVRACHDMEAETELYFAYRPALPHQTYEETQKGLSGWGFNCSCALCLDKKSTSRNTIQQRKTLISGLKAILRPEASITQLTRARKTLESLEKTYTARESVPLVPRLELWDPYFALGAELLDRKRSPDGLEMLLKGLEALGFSIVACPPRNGVDEKDCKRATLEIKRWGQANDYTASTFFRMMHAYEKLAPELCEVAKEYASVAYSICYGEKETIGILSRHCS
ncbi:hypothetical protein BKA67DRAFT_585158 [Truncatella angustata]|uniref:SET domain-containing protein n=1 Tax=Truncatella angustata TaxID=152316 RepID=A0A9P8RGD6_9PEZI|nr:uncharacterized protein BKA67DRAFT_585158 [Truncatella angustata]KAH6645483.1 hypothetical protein BKA67DRAFT_585158 [Truncatella angustata]KAH8200929.1 hypothetical protein TruAng_004938 [Truncatella angustata]